MKHFAQYADYQIDAYTALNTAFAQEGSFIQVADNSQIETPIVLHYIYDSSAGAAMAFPRNLVLLGRNSEVKIIEKFEVLGEQSIWSNVVTEIALEQDARAQFYKVQDDNAHTYHLNHTQVHQTKGSTFTCLLYTSPSPRDA